VQRFEVPLTTTGAVVAHHVEAMGSTAEFMVVGGATAALVEWAVDRLAELEASWSRFRADSELRALDRSAGAVAVAVSPDLVDAIGRALALWYVTDGLFDPTVRRALEEIGYDRTFREVASTGPAPAFVPRPTRGCDGLQVDRAHSTVTLPEGIVLDLGGVGKGLAADILATGLVERGASGACVSIGGDVRVAGSPVEGDTWSIRVEDPLDESRALCTRQLVDEAIVTSTTRFRQWSRGGKALHHLIDPFTGAPADRGVTAVVAQAEEAWWAEGIAKAALVAGVEPGLGLLERLGVAAVLVDTNGVHHCTGSWEPM
jgi:FAD:protein FMN transferase